ncbi:hypothetical protein B296_00045811 [Ensete ventricosum]|uniref:Uncharacterized protein n=1 Tax=Ensete ventricosum TaxID=4639 RepID=A0A426YN80_ENSVE|nr:hypothetical protein B296_00045811 [Ensete ventricosum]
MLLHHQSLDGDILVGPLQHFWHDRRGSLHERPKEARRPDPDHESLDNQRQVRVGNDPDLLYEMGEVQAEVFIFLLPHPEEGCNGRLRSYASEEVGLKLSRELIKRVDEASGNGHTTLE